MKVNKVLSFENGFSIVESLISMVIMTVLMLATYTLITRQQKSFHSFVQKIEIIEFTEKLKQILKNSEKCKFNLFPNSVIIDPSSWSLYQIKSQPASVPEVQNIYDGKVASEPLIAEKNKQIDGILGLIPKNIYLNNWAKTEESPTKIIYRTDLEIQIESNAGPFSPIHINGITITTDATGKVTGCGLGDSTFKKWSNYPKAHMPINGNGCQAYTVSNGKVHLDQVQFAPPTTKDGIQFFNNCLISPNGISFRDVFTEW